MNPKSPRSNLKTPEKKSNKHVTWKEASGSSSREVTPRRSLANPSPRPTKSPEPSMRPIKQSPKSPVRSQKRGSVCGTLVVKKPRIERFSDPSEILFKANHFFQKLRKSFKDRKGDAVELYLQIQDEVREWKNTEVQIYESERELQRVVEQLELAEEKRRTREVECQHFSAKLSDSISEIITKAENLMRENGDIAKPQVIVLD